MIKMRLDTTSFNNRLKRMERNLNKEKPKFLKKTGTFLRDKISKNTPIDSWLAKRSWETRINKNGFTISNEAKSSWKYYLQFVNNWTKSIKARRFLEKTINRYRTILKKQKQKLIKDILK